MQQNYSKEIDPIQKATKNTASSVLDASSQSESLQRKADMANNAAQREEAPRPNNTGMPDNLKSGIESLSGFSMDDVRVHYNSSKPATVQALAYTQGTDIHVAPGQEKHLPHEAWHVAQQMAGRVSPTTNINGMPVNDNAALEHEADVMGEKAVQMKADESKTVQRATIWNGVVQRDVDLKEYYYHISKTGIPADKEINPKIALENGVRSTRGDDLGPGFYMGDSTFLKYYYDNNFQGVDAYIYYIEKGLIDNTMEESITDFTRKTAPVPTQEYGLDNWFQIAMVLGFCFNKELIPLDLLANAKTDEFKKCVEIFYPKVAKQIINFFINNAQEKAIWKGYINDVDNGEIIITLEEEEIVDFLSKVIPIDAGVVKKNVLIHELRGIVPKVLKLVGKNREELINHFVDGKRDEIDKKLKIISKTLSKKIPISNFVSDYKKLLKQHDYEAKLIYMGKNSEVRPMQIAIRRDVKYTENGKNKSLLGKIKDNEIKIAKGDIDDAMKTKSDASKTGETKDLVKTEPETSKTGKTEVDKLKDELRMKLTVFLAGTSTPTTSQSSPA